MNKIPEDILSKYKSIGNEPLKASKSTIKYGKPRRVKPPMDLNGRNDIDNSQYVNSPKNDSIYDITKYKPFSTVYPRPRRLIHGPDDRIIASVEKFPYRNICLLLINDLCGTNYYGTGFFISEKCVITAGHCVTRNGIWAKEVEVIPGAHNGFKPFGSSSSKIFKSVKGWFYGNDKKYDHGAVILSDNKIFNSANTYFRFKSYNGENPIEISGYPEDKQGEQWTCIGTATYDNSNILHKVDTEEGDSGSPVFVKNGDNFLVVGVHTVGGSINNSATRVNEKIIKVWTEWSNL
jgi:glutamyl endopeptidase